MRIQNRITFRSCENPNIMMNRVARVINFNDVSMVRRTDKKCFNAIIKQRSTNQFKLPNFVDIPGTKGVRIMQKEVSVGLFSAVMLSIVKYKIEGHNADKLIQLIKDPIFENKPITNVSFKDAKEFAFRMSVLTGRDFRLPTNLELILAKSLFKTKNFLLSLKNKTDNSNMIFVLSPKLDARGFFVESYREPNVSFVLVEVLPKKLS